MVVADDPLEVIAQEVLVPVVLAEEFLQRPRRNAGVDGDRLDALLGDVGELPGDVHRQVDAGVFSGETVVEPLEELLQRGLELAELRDVHARPSVNRGGEHIFAAADGSSRCDLAL